MTVPKTGQYVALTKLTIAIAAKGPFDPNPFLAGLGGAGGALRKDIEVIIAHDDTVPSALIPFPFITQIVCRGSSVFQLWGAAIEGAHSTYVAIMDINVPPGPGWLDAMLASIEDGTIACYGPVNASYLPTDRRNIGYLVEYVQFHAPIAIDLGEIPGNNFVVRRDLIEDHALSKNGFSKTALLLRWSAAPPIAIDEAVVDHRKPFVTRDYIVRRYQHGRCYAANRFAANLRLSRLGFAVLTILLPFVRVQRIWRHSSRVSGFGSVFLRFLPIIFAAEAAWSFGEFCGYMAGDGGCATMLD
ncbi:hypothetical protein BH09PSE3_BH09PSE3_00220 [soil metagenome]